MGLDRSFGLQEVKVSRISRQLADGGEVFQPTVTLTPQERDLVLISVRGYVSTGVIVRLEGLH
jgi:hypothetical protein